MQHPEVTLSLAANIAALSPLKTLCTVLCKALYSLTPSLPDIFCKIFMAYNKFLLLRVSSYIKCISRLIVCFSNFPIEVPGFGRFNATTEYV